MDCKPSPKGCGVVWQNPSSTVALLLGDRRNACAAMWGIQLAGYNVSHVICVGNVNTSRMLEKSRERSLKEGLRGCQEELTPKARKLSTLESLGTTSTAASGNDSDSDSSSGSDQSADEKEEEVPEESAVDFGSQACVEAAEERSRRVSFKAYTTADKMPASAVIDIGTDMQEQLAGINGALEASEQASLAQHGAPTAVLLHCDLGVNRSPTLALAFLVQKGYSLREAYRRVQGRRPVMDPIPPFRRALREYEHAMHGSNSVDDTEYFAMHISELVTEAEKSLKKESSKDNIDDESESDHQCCTTPKNAFDKALLLRRTSIESLLHESKEQARTHIWDGSERSAGNLARPPAAEKKVFPTFTEGSRVRKHRFRKARSWQPTASVSPDLKLDMT